MEIQGPHVVKYRGREYIVVEGMAYPLNLAPEEVHSTREEREDGGVDVTMHMPRLRVLSRGHGPG